ncbi:MAG: putative glutamine amidotransferase [Cyclobacteriaceae bacterium]|jgi:putative glutamine amidotransferase
MLKIGVSACFMYPDPKRSVFSPKTLSYIENDMATFLTRRGVMPVLIPDVDFQIQKELLDQMDGFIFQGGTDMAPESYGEDCIENGRWKGDIVRDKYELKLMDYAVNSGKPILGICRGMQLMNIYFGGSLYQDTSTQRLDVQVHRDADLYDQLIHQIRFSTDCFLAKIYADATCDQVNSVHHQSIARLGKNLVVLAECPQDGVIEAIGYVNAPEGRVMAVQWHPEFSYTLGKNVIDAEKLYDHFLNEVYTLKNQI